MSRPRRPIPMCASRILAALALFGTGACASGTKAQDPTQLKSGRRVDASALLEKLQAAGASRSSLRTEGRMTYFGNGERVRLRMVLAVARPGKFRLEMLSPFMEPIDVMTSDGETLSWLHQKVLYRGPSTPENVGRLFPVNMDGTALVDTVLGGVVSSADFRTEAAVALEDGSFQLRLRSVQGPVVVLSCDASHRVTQMRWVRPNRSFADVEYSDWDQALGVPQRIQVSDKSRDVEVQIRLKRPELNVALEAGLFRIGDADTPAQPF